MNFKSPAMFCTVSSLSALPITFPLVALKSIQLCISGIAANVKQCEKYAAQTSQIVTVLSPIIGYAKACELAKESLQSSKTIIELVRERELLNEKQIKELMDPFKLTVPH